MGLLTLNCHRALRIYPLGQQSLDNGIEFVTLYYSVNFICHFSAYWQNLSLICVPVTLTFQDLGLGWGLPIWRVSLFVHASGLLIKCTFVTGISKAS